MKCVDFFIPHEYNLNDFLHALEVAKFKLNVKSIFLRVRPLDSDKLGDIACKGQTYRLEVV